MSAVLAAVQAGVLLKHRGFDLDLSVSGPHTTGLDDGKELGPIKPRVVRTQACTRRRYTFRHARKIQMLGKRIHGRPSGLAELRPVSVRGAIAPCDAGDAANPAPIHVIRVSRPGLACFDSCPQNGLGASLRPTSACVQYRKRLTSISILV